MMKAMSQGILAAPDSAKDPNYLIWKLWQFKSAYECIEAMEDQNILYGAVESDWPTSIAIALKFANSVLREAAEKISEIEGCTGSSIKVSGTHIQFTSV